MMRTIGNAAVAMTVMSSAVVGLTQASSALAGAQAIGDSQISAAAGNSRIVIRTQARFAGAIALLTWSGKQFIDKHDHGRELQSASSFSGHGECFNPTEAGSRTDGTGPTSSSQLLALAIPEANRLRTSTRMAFWLRPGESASCGRAVNTTRVSNHILDKQVTIRHPASAHAIEYLTTFRIPSDETHRSATFEAATGYMPTEFSKFWLYDPATDTLTLDRPPPGGGEQAKPVIVSTSNHHHAMGVYSPDLPQPGWSTIGYGRFDFRSVTKWNCVFRTGAVAASASYNYRCFVAIGTLENVKVTIKQLHDHYN